MSKNRKLFRIVPLILVAMFALSCEKDNYTEELTATDDMSLAKYSYGPYYGDTKFISIYDSNPYKWLDARKPASGAYEKEIVYIGGAINGTYIPISIDESIPSGWVFVTTMGDGQKLIVYNGN